MSSGQQYVSDVAVTSREADRLGRWPFAERIADTLANRSDPASLVVGVYGRWGEGKSTVLEFIAQRLTNHPNVVTVRFNPWLFTNDQELFTGFFHQVADALDRKLTTNTQRLGEMLKTYGSLFTTIGAPDGTASTAMALGESLARTSPSELRTRLEKALGEQQTRIVVLLDDLDRLDKSEAQAVFRLLKVAADFQWTSYVLALDREVVAGALAERYPGRPDGGDEFLDKIIQVPLTLPSVPREALQKLFYEDVDGVLKDSAVELSDGEVRRLLTHFDRSLMHRVTTLRAAKRYANAIQFVLPMLRGEVDTVDLLLIEALRIFHPKLHAAIVRNSKGCLEGAENAGQRDALRADLKANSDTPRGDQSSDVRLLEGLFPKLESVYGNTTHSDRAVVEWRRGKRIASPEYFPRYFASGVPVGDVSDAALACLLKFAAKGDSEAATEALVHALRNSNADRVVQKLLDSTTEITGGSALAVAKAVADCGPAFPKASGPLSQFFSPRSRAALLVSDLLIRSGSNAAQVADFLSYIDLAFSLLVLRWLGPDGESQSQSFDDAAWSAIASSTAKRVMQQAENRWVLENDDGAERLQIWREFGDASALQKHIEESIADAPIRVLDLVQAHCQSATLMDSGKVCYQAMTEAGYRRLAGVSATDCLAVAVIGLYGPPDPTKELEPRYARTNQELAHSFLRLHAKHQPPPKNAKGPQRKRTTGNKASAKTRKRS